MLSVAFDLKNQIISKIKFSSDLESYPHDNILIMGMGGSGIAGDVMKILLTIGICSEKLCPYGVSFDKLSKEQQLLCYKDAKKNVIYAYSRIYSIDNLKKALYLYGPVLICFPIYHYDAQMWLPKNSNNALLGGHAMTVVGYNEYGFQIRNSWGEDWGDHGYDTYYYSDWGSHWEIWSTIDAQTKSILKNNSTNDIMDDVSDQNDIQNDTKIDNKETKLDNYSNLDNNYIIKIIKNIINVAYNIVFDTAILLLKSLNNNL